METDDLKKIKGYLFEMLWYFRIGIVISLISLIYSFSLLTDLNSDVSVDTPQEEIAPEETVIFEEGSAGWHQVNDHAVDTIETATENYTGYEAAAE
jgi:hypothetical protein